MKAFRMQHPLLFWLGTTAAIVESALVAPGSSLLARQIPYAAASIARYDLILPPLKSALLAWLPWVAVAVGFSGALVVLMSALCGGLGRTVRVTLVLIALLLIAINLIWAQWVLL